LARIIGLYLLSPASPGLPTHRLEPAGSHPFNLHFSNCHVLHGQLTSTPSFFFSIPHFQNTIFTLAHFQSMTIPPRSEHVAHKVWVSVPQPVELLPGGIVDRLALPPNQDFDERMVILRSRVPPSTSTGSGWRSPLALTGGSLGSAITVVPSLSLSWETWNARWMRVSGGRSSSYATFPTRRTTRNGL